MTPPWEKGEYKGDFQTQHCVYHPFRPGAGLISGGQLIADGLSSLAFVPGVAQSLMILIGLMFCPRIAYPGLYLIRPFRALTTLRISIS